MNNVVALTVLGVVFVVAAIVAFGVEPHWSSRDGRRFIARAALFDRDGNHDWVEVRGNVDHESVRIFTRRERHGHLDGVYRFARTGEGSRRTTVVFLRGERDIVLRLPRHSRTLAAITATANSEATLSD